MGFRQKGSSNRPSEIITQTEDTTTNDTILDAEQMEKVTAVLADAIQTFLENNYEDSEYLREDSIKMDLQDHGKDYAFDYLYEVAQPDFKQNNPQYTGTDMSWLKLPEEDTDEEEAFRELLDELYDAALERVRWHVGIIVSVEEK